MNIGLFGGTFDPVHRGHLAVARAAAERFALKQVLFVPASRPPHKAVGRTPFLHRYAMLALALSKDKDFIPSLLEAPDGSDRPSYTLDTVRRAKKGLGKAARLHVILGIDAFEEIATWHEAVTLLREAEFIVASRPGWSLGDVAAALPAALRPNKSVLKTFSKGALSRTTGAGDVVLDQGRVVLHLLPEVKVPFSSSEARSAVAGKRSLARFVTPEVAEYIRKQHLYRKWV
ncbi:MAG: nicotinate (nicotinamide) nucleotide adenylyltransferase [Candidatus Koribacter versatilis]|uniref:Probable nicotinate-nucleotide adenylyltransferase n=1 Tax=Candidatus Korobacter versatilis TaxID=658062 RepID=A0A932EPV9_9BACT|nr:nicotinate (nicotinamide) nucleotide adenylyltransferase [Candidatus Koribacter versatilis]